MEPLRVGGDSASTVGGKGGGEDMSGTEGRTGDEGVGGVGERGKLICVGDPAGTAGSTRTVYIEWGVKDQSSFV